MTDDVRRPISVDPFTQGTLQDLPSQGAIASSPFTLSVDASFHDDVWESLSLSPKDPQGFFDDLLTRIIEATLQEVATETHQKINPAASLIASLTLMNNDQVQELNKQYRHKDKPTNVLSFESGQDLNALFSKTEEGGESPPIILGDIILAYGVIEQESQEQQKAFLDHLTHMMIHSVLHLLGYDHEDDAEADDMEGLEIQILEKYFNIKNPYLSDNYTKGES